MSFSYRGGGNTLFKEMHKTLFILIDNVLRKLVRIMQIVVSSMVSCSYGNLTFKVELNS